MSHEPSAFFAPGARVVICDIVKRAELNGARGILLEFDHGAERWHVRVANGETIALRVANLQPSTEATVCVHVKTMAGELLPIEIALDERVVDVKQKLQRALCTRASNDLCTSDFGSHLTVHLFTACAQSDWFVGTGRLPAWQLLRGRYSESAVHSVKLLSSFVNYK